MYNLEIFNKTGRELLPENIIKQFEEISCINYRNILENRLSEYTWGEWLFCLKEQVLLEQCMSFVFEMLDMNPLIPGCFFKGEVLYEVTRIDKSFWTAHEDWYEHIRTIIYKALSMNEMDEGNTVIPQEYKDILKKSITEML